MGKDADDMIRRVDGDLLRAGHAHRRVAEHADHLFDGVFAGQGIAALEYANLFAGVFQKDVDGRCLALAPFLDVEADAGVALHVLAHDLFGAVGAAGSDDDDLGDLDLIEPLVEHGLQQPPDVCFLIVGGNAYAAPDLVLCHYPFTLPPGLLTRRPCPARARGRAFKVRGQYTTREEQSQTPGHLRQQRDGAALTGAFAPPRRLPNCPKGVIMRPFSGMDTTSTESQGTDARPACGVGGFDKQHQGGTL